MHRLVGFSGRFALQPRFFFLCSLRHSLENNFLRAVPKSQSQHVSCHQIMQLISLDIFQSHLVVLYLLTQTPKALFPLFFFFPQNTPAHSYILNLYLLIFFIFVYFSSAAYHTEDIFHSLTSLLRC